MISVVVYGRNDSHGYNLHKRGAISLNCIAEVLTGAGDEILFVDYNSPDQIPTFPEAIADTLTDRARELLRIFRIRPQYHKQFAGQTHLVALESQSRNIAIRRSNPSNRWILSTNTDMIFIPREARPSMTDAIAGLGDGFYHLPRFELPEVLWETCDRRSPAETIRKVAEWSGQFHLNEIVYGSFDNVYEAPGDFQLFLRDDLFAIGGFDESMIRGWHVDSNMARRMKLFRGEVKSAVDLVLGYHCGHTRQATSLHGSGFTANSIDTYVRNVDDPVLHAQLQTWGAPECEFEERRLNEHGVGRIAGALSAAIEEPAVGFSEVALDDESFDRTRYDADHVVPHLINLLGEIAPNQKLLLIGEDERLFAQLATALTTLGLSPTLLRAESEKDVPFARAVTLAEGLDQADLIVLQFPDYDECGSEDWVNARWRIQRALEKLIAFERERPRDERRLIVLVNAAHSKLQDLFLPAMSFTAIPYTARLRHGYVTLPSANQEPSPDCAPGKLRPFVEDELAMLRHLADAADAPSGWERLALDLPQMVKAAGLGEDDARAERLLAAASEHVAKSVARCATEPTPDPERYRTGGHLSSATDWEDPEWLALAERCFGAQVYAQGARSRWTWERISLLQSLRANVDEARRPWVLVVTNGPDVLPTFVAYQGYKVAYASYQRFMELAGESVAPWSDTLRVWNMAPHGDLLPLDLALERGIQKFDAVLLAGTDVSAGGLERADRVGERLRQLTDSGAFVSATVHVHLNHAEETGALSYNQWCSMFGDAGFAERLGLDRSGRVAREIPLDCAVRFAPEDEVRYVPGLSFGWGSSFVTIGIVSGWRGRAPGDRKAAEPYARRASAVTPPADQVVKAAVASTSTEDVPNDGAFPPHAVEQATRIASGGFACRVLPGIERDLAAFARRADEGELWFALPIELTAGGSVRVRGPLTLVAFVHEGGYRSGKRDEDGSWLFNSLPTRGSLLFLSADETPTIAVGTGDQ